MPPLAIASATVDAFQPDYTPVAVFIGGTSGVGEAMVNRLGNSLKGNIHIIIVGRNKSAAQATLASLPAPPGSTSPLRDFVYCDASLMENIESASDDLKGVVARVGGKIHFLVNSAGYGSVIPVDTTKDGLDEQLVVRYYARWKFIDELLPLVRKARDAGEAARVMSILGGGRLFGTNSNIPAQDLSFEKSWWLVRPLKACFYSVVYNDLMIEVSLHFYVLGQSSHMSCCMARSSLRGIQVLHLRTFTPEWSTPQPMNEYISIGCGHQYDLFCGWRSTIRLRQRSSRQNGCCSD